MQHTVTRLKDARVQIAVTLDPQEWEAERGKAEERLAKEFQAEGFRQGKAPVELMRSKLGEEAVLTETAREAVQHALQEVARKEHLDFIGEPELQVQKLAPGNPFVFTVTSSVVPELELPDYKQLASAVPPRQAEVASSEVEDALEWLRKSKAEEGKAPPELTDEFAQSLGAFQGLEEVRESVKEGLQQEKESRERQRRRQEILEKIVERTQGEVPEVLLEREREGMLENLKQGVKEQLGMEFADYLQKVNKTQEDLEQEFREQAAKRVKGSLVLRQVAKAEGVQVEPAEVEQGAQQILANWKDPEEARKTIDPERLREYTRGVLEDEKTFQLLEQQAGTQS